MGPSIVRRHAGGAISPESDGAPSLPLQFAAQVPASRPVAFLPFRRGPGVRPPVQVCQFGPQFLVALQPTGGEGPVRECRSNGGNPARSDACNRGTGSRGRGRQPRRRPFLPRRRLPTGPNSQARRVEDQAAAGPGEQLPLCRRVPASAVVADRRRRLCVPTEQAVNERRLADA